jgi:hypothetical protein
MTRAPNKNPVSPAISTASHTRPANVALLALIVVFLLLPLWIVRYPPLLDYPDHLARAFILVHINDPAYSFSKSYFTEWGAYPYLGMDLSLIALQYLFPPLVAGRVLLSICVLLVPLSGWWFLRQANPGHSALALWTLLLSYDPFFLYGFVNFQLGLALCFFTLGLWLRYLEKSTTRRWLIALALATCCYFTHLIAFGIAGFIVLVYSLARRLNLSQLLWSGTLFIPGLILFLLSRIGSYNGTEAQFQSVRQKLSAISTQLLHTYSQRLELFAFCAIILCLLAAWLRNHEFHWNTAWLIVFLAVLGLYLALPYELGDTWLIDVRLIPALFLLLLAVAKLGRRQRALALVALLLFAMSTVDIVCNFRSQQPPLLNMAQAIQILPRNVRLFPIINRDIVQDDLLHQTYAHFWAYAIIQRGALAPYLFDLKGQTPLRRKEHGYVPEDPETNPPDWDEVCKNYDYVWTYDADYYTSDLLTLGNEAYHSSRFRLFHLTNCSR